MTTAEQDRLAQLRELLHAAAQSPPADAVPGLAAARAAAAGDRLLGCEVAQAEARWLLGATCRDPELATARAAAAAAATGLTDRCRAGAPRDDVEALFEVVELLAAAAVAGREDDVRRLRAELDERAAQVADRERICQEADERWAAQTAARREQAEASGASALQLAVHEHSAALLRSLARRLHDRRLLRCCRRARRTAGDLRLAARLERLLGARGLRLLERTSFVLLLVVVGILVVEAAIDLSPAQATVLHWVDGLACTFFVIEFALGLSLAPRRGGWFVRHFGTDLLPALPSVLMLWSGTMLPGLADNVVLLRLLRLRIFRLALLMVRGADGLVRRFRRLLDRNLVFLAEHDRGAAARDERRDLVFAALLREQSLVAALPASARRELLRARLADLAARCDELRGDWPEGNVNQDVATDLPVDAACELLWTLRPGDIGRHLGAADLAALDRAVRVVSTPPLRWLPLLRRLAVHPLPATPEERIVAAGRRVADWLMRWQDGLQFFADLHGIVTGPQILDRVASAMVKASQRPAVRLLLFGGLFLLFDWLIQSRSISAWLQHIVVGPLLILGSVCLVFLMLGWWLKRVAGEASESFRMTAEAHFVSLLSLQKRRHESADTEFLGRRVLAGVTAGDPVQLLRLQLQGARAGVPLDVEGFDAREERIGSRVALLYLHFLDGALLHDSDVKTTEQLLANLSLENLRHGLLGYQRRERRRLRQLRLDDGSIMRGPFLWFRFITESIAVETSKRITEYNRRCVPLERRRRLDAAAEQQLREWLQRRCDPKAGRTLERLPPPDAGTVYATTEFHALHFLCKEAERDEHVRATFGDDVLAALCADRRNMVREIFGTRPPPGGAAAQTLNVWRLYWSRLSHGRLLLLPLLFALRALRALWWFVGRMRQIVREVLSPHLAMQRREPGTATFAVALRKIHRMKAPGLLEAIRMRVLVDPEYCGVPADWTTGGPASPVPELERDLDFLQLPERERAVFRAHADRSRELVATLHAAMDWLPPLLAAADGDGAPDAAARRDAALAVTVAWICDRDDARTLLAAEVWRTTGLPELLAAGRCAGAWTRAWWRLRDVFTAHPVDVWLVRMRQPTSRLGRRRLRTAYAVDPHVRATVAAWNRLAADQSPTQVAIDRLRAHARDGAEIRRELTALRAVQSLSVLDVRNYRAAVFDLGGYADDGEDAAQALALP